MNEKTKSHVEYVDLVDSSGKIVQYKIPKTKIERYPESFLQIVVVGIFNQKGEVLIQKRSKNKTTEPNSLDLVCGALKSGEDWKEATMREAMEESGINLEVTNLKLIVEGINPNSRYRYAVHALTDLVPNPEIINPDEVEWSKYMSIEVLKQMFENNNDNFVYGFIDELELVRSRGIP